MTLVNIGCKRNLTYISNYFKTAFLCAPSRQTHDSMQNFTEVDRRTLYVNGWTPLTEPHLCKNLLHYLLAQSVNFKAERYDETRVLTLCTRRIGNFLSSMALKVSAFQCAVYATNVSITDAFPPESRETLVQHKLFKYNMTYDIIAPHFANRSASMIQFYA